MSKRQMIRPLNLFARGSYEALHPGIRLITRKIRETAEEQVAWCRVESISIRSEPFELADFQKGRASQQQEMPADLCMRDVFSDHQRRAFHAATGQEQIGVPHT